jgi:chromosome segregation ATPase
MGCTKGLGIILIMSCVYNLTAGPLGGFLRNRKVLNTKKKTRTIPVALALDERTLPTPNQLITQQSQEPPIPVAQPIIQEQHTLKVQLVHEQEQVQLLIKEKTAMIDQIEQLKRTIEDLHLQLNNQQRQFYKVQQQACEIADEREALRKERNGLLVKQQKLLAEQQEIKDNMLQLQQLRADIEQEIKQQYAQQLDETHKKITTAEKKMKLNNEKHQKILDRTVLKEQDISGKNKQIALLKEQIAQKTRRIEGLEGHVQKALENFTNEKYDKICYREELKKLSKENHQLRLEKNEIIKTTKAEIQALKHELIESDVEQEIAQKIEELGQKKPVTVSQNKP